MVFNSFQFLWLFPIIFAGYYFLPSLFPKAWRRDSKVANMLLLAISYGLYMQWNPAYALILLGVTAITYVFALRINRGGQKTRTEMADSLWCYPGFIPITCLQILQFHHRVIHLRISFSRNSRFELGCTIRHFFLHLSGRRISI